jgi:hypothetical protein
MKGVMTGICRQILEVTFWVRNMPRPVFVSADDGDSGNNMFVLHMVLLATLKSGESFCVDITGDQFGIRNPVCMWDDFAKSHVASVQNAEPLGSFNVVQEREIQKKPLPVTKSHQMRKSICSALKGCLETGLKSKKMDFDTLIKMAPNDFNQCRKSLLADVEASFDKEVSKIEAKWTLPK